MIKDLDKMQDVERERTTDTAMKGAGQRRSYKLLSFGATTPHRLSLVQFEQIRIYGEGGGVGG